MISVVKGLTAATRANQHFIEVFMRLLGSIREVDRLRHRPLERLSVDGNESELGHGPRDTGQNLAYRDAQLPTGGCRQTIE